MPEKKMQRRLWGGEQEAATVRCEGFNRRGGGFKQATGLGEEARDTGALLTTPNSRLSHRGSPFGSHFLGQPPPNRICSTSVTTVPGALQ